MSRRTKPTGIIAFIVLCVSALSGQQAIIASGGEGIGVGGVMSYSIGQVAYTSSEGTFGTASQGVQQAYLEIMVSSEDISQSASIRLFPNPSSSYTSIALDETSAMTDFSSFSYQVFDVYGHHLWSENIGSSLSIIPTVGLATGMYILKVIYKNQSIKTFRFIKTE